MLIFNNFFFAEIRVVKKKDAKKRSANREEPNAHKVLIFNFLLQEIYAHVAIIKAVTNFWSSQGKGYFSCFRVSFVHCIRSGAILHTHTLEESFEPTKCEIGCDPHCFASRSETNLGFIYLLLFYLSVWPRVTYIRHTNWGFSACCTHVFSLQSPWIHNVRDYTC